MRISDWWNRSWNLCWLTKPFCALRQMQKSTMLLWPATHSIDISTYGFDAGVTVSVFLCVSLQCLLRLHSSRSRTSASFTSCVPRVVEPCTCVLHACVCVRAVESMINAAGKQAGCNARSSFTVSRQQPIGILFVCWSRSLVHLLEMWSVKHEHTLCAAIHQVRWSTDPLAPTLMFAEISNLWSSFDLRRRATRAWHGGRQAYIIFSLETAWTRNNVLISYLLWY